jgi:hypothetical protein
MTRCEINGDKITLTKEEIQRKKEHYFDMADKYPRFNMRKFYYVGLGDAMNELLKEFDNEEE